MILEKDLDAMLYGKFTLSFKEFIIYKWRLGWESMKLEKCNELNLKNLKKVCSFHLIKKNFLSTKQVSFFEVPL